PLVIPLGRVTSAMSNVGTGAVQLIQRGFDTAGMTAELAFYRLREPLIDTPERKLDTWLTVLQDRSRKDAKELASAAKDAEWIRSKESGASAEARVKALAVAGFALRNQEKYAEAKAALTEAVQESAALKTAGPWRDAAKQALAELSDPRSYYLPRIE